MLTMFLVVIGHCSYYTIATPYGGIYYSELINGENYSVAYRCLRYLVAFIYTFHMPLFIALSGMLFSLSMKKGISFHKMVKDKAIRLLMPFLAVSLFLSIPIKYFTDYWSDSDNLLGDIVCGQLLLMGNSHLWFIVALFWIFIGYYFIEKYEFKKNVLFWTFLIVISWIGWYLFPKNDFLGLPAAMKHLFFFAVGYNILPMVAEKRLRKKELVFGISFFFIVSTLFSFLCIHYQNLFIIKLFRPILFPVFALAGIFLICDLSKQINIHFSHKEYKPFSFFKKNTYELYLYSDPFNYLLVYFAWLLLGDNILTDDILSIAMFFARAICSLIFAVLIVYLVRFLHLKRIVRIKM